MTGHVRRHGAGWAYVIDVERHPAQRCRSCRRRQWVERGELTTCPKCGGQMEEPRRERRQRWHGGYKTKKAAEKELREALGRQEGGDDPFPASITFRDYVPRWEAHKRASGKVRAITMHRYQQLLDQNVLPHLGGLALQRIRPAHVQVVLDEMAEQGYAPATIRQARAVISSVFSTAVAGGLVRYNPATAAQGPKVERPDLAVPTSAQVAALMEAAEDTPWAVPIVLAAVTGARRSEVLAVEWKAVDLEDGRVRITRNLQRVRGEGLRFFPPKSKRSRRELVLPGFVLPRLRSHRAEQAQRRLLLGEGWQDHDLVCERGDGMPLDPDAFSHAFKRLGRKAGLHPDTRLHDCRHGFATTLLERGVDPAITSAVLGHSSTYFTADVYQHVSNRLAGLAAEAIGEALEGR